MEQIFRKHNQWQWLYSDRDHLSAITFDAAVQLIELNIWEDRKKNYIVILPKVIKY